MTVPPLRVQYMTSLSEHRQCVFCNSNIDLDQYPPTGRNLRGWIEFPDSNLASLGKDTLNRPVYHWKCLLAWEGQPELAMRQLQQARTMANADTCVFQSALFVVRKQLPRSEYDDPNRTTLIIITFGQLGSHIVTTLEDWHHWLRTSDWKQLGVGIAAEEATELMELRSAVLSSVGQGGVPT